SASSSPPGTGISSMSFGSSCFPAFMCGVQAGRALRMPPATRVRFRCLYLLYQFFGLPKSAVTLAKSVWIDLAGPPTSRELKRRVEDGEQDDSVFASIAQSY